jgi:outer membrane receptor for ferrienterochelin and colicins
MVRAVTVLGMLLLCWVLWLVPTLAPGLMAQQVAKDTTTAVADTTWRMEGRLADVVVTAARRAQSVAEVSVPTTVIRSADIQAQGAVRLSDLLAEQTGLTLVHDHGTGLQVQGFDPDYTLILIDGERVIGRTAGTLSLDRISVAHVERVEVVRGPSSSLYGSDALAGVVNIITKEARQPLEASAQTRYGTHDTSDLNARVGFKEGAWKGQAVLNRFASGGYDVHPDAVGNTTPSFTDYSGRGRLSYRLSDRTAVSLSSGYAQENVSNTVGVGRAAEEHRLRQERRDWRLTPEVQHRLGSTWSAEASYHAARYQTDAVVRRNTTGEVTDESAFDQFFGEGEVQVRGTLGRSHILTLGAGHIRESLIGDRFDNERRSTDQFFGFAQHEWLARPWLDLTLSARVDAHSAYATQVTPRASVLVRPTDWVRLRASVGSGFKAPAFRQLFLNFTNPTVGYTVLGADEVGDRLAELQAQGRIQRVDADLSTLGDIEAERSWAINIGGNMQPVEWLAVDVNLFQNRISNLIDTQPIAGKTNGQSVFTYLNLDRVRTRGVESEVSVGPFAGFTLGLGYQLLEAVDLDVLEGIDDGRFFRRTEGREVRLMRSDYGGLLNRSRHSGTLSVRYTDDARGTTAALRGVYRSRYGYRNAHGNAFLDDDRDYAPGYTLWHLTLTQRLTSQLHLQVGGRNLSDYTDPARVPSLSGREFFAGLELSL